MSVINQMLKDLDKRQATTSTDERKTGTVIEQPSILPMVLLILVALVICNVIGWYMWQLYREANTGQAQVEQVTTAAQLEQTVTKPVPSTIEQVVNTEPAKKSALPTLNSEAQGVKKAPISPMAATVIATNTDNNVQASVKSGEQIATNLVSEQSGALVARESSNKADNNRVTQPGDTEPTSALAATSEPVAKLSISRKKLSPTELAAKKFNQAKQAIENNNVSKAETLLEQALLLTAENSDIRKQLAALWYGRKAYQDAIELLIKGLAITPNDTEMRIMAARVYLERNQYRAALKLLLPLQHQQDMQVQALIANTAAQLNEHQTAIIAYQSLTKLAADVGRWWLGLAISYDSLAQFEQAKAAYRTALAQQNLSAQANSFARQRLIELGD